MLEVFETYAPTHPALWVVPQQREYRIQWRFISLRLLNKDIATTTTSLVDVGCAALRWR